MTQFTALTDFYSEDTQSEYIGGMVYTARDGDETLLKLLPKWIKEGKVRRASLRLRCRVPPR